MLGEGGWKKGGLVSELLGPVSHRKSGPHPGYWVTVSGAGAPPEDPPVSLLSLGEEMRSSSSSLVMFESCPLGSRGLPGFQLAPVTSWVLVPAPSVSPSVPPWVPGPLPPLEPGFAPGCQPESCQALEGTPGEGPRAPPSLPAPGGGCSIPSIEGAHRSSLWR